MCMSQTMSKTIPDNLRLRHTSTYSLVLVNNQCMSMWRLSRRTENSIRRGECNVHMPNLVRKSIQSLRQMTERYFCCFVFFLQFTLSYKSPLYFSVVQVEIEHPAHSSAYTDIVHTLDCCIWSPCRGKYTITCSFKCVKLLFEFVVVFGISRVPLHINPILCCIARVIECEQE